MLNSTPVLILIPSSSNCVLAPLNIKKTLGGLTANGRADETSGHKNTENCLNFMLLYRKTNKQTKKYTENIYMPTTLKVQNIFIVIQRVFKTNKQKQKKITVHNYWL